ncbi:DEAD/DEAH box helicase [Orrella sp. 11846]|uniref:DEAD/DEAH box helicase n=1 Tax=Orrella sp. 11846 TaxID=3409913 RepID=UPI003B59BB2B
MSTQTTFASLGLDDRIVRALHEEQYETPTPIQAQSIPVVLSGRDLLAAAQTGTGKTAGFTLPILQKLIEKPRTAKVAGAPRVLVLTPTRELAAQVHESVVTYSRHLTCVAQVMFGGVNINPQIRALKGRVDILVATPGRLLDHVGQKTVDLSQVEILVLDEADRMLDMGFIHDIRRVLKYLPKTRQNLLFSATFSDEIRDLAKRTLGNPVEVSVAPKNVTADRVEQVVYHVDQSQKRDLLSHIIRGHGWHQVLVFTRTKHGANRLAEKLVKDGLSAAAIHGNKSQNARTRALDGFKNGKLSVLVATDIAARGLDIEDLPQVVNFELPNVAEDYVHRIGRTGRAGAEGEAMSLVDKAEVKHLKAIERLIGRTIPMRDLPTDWVPSAKPDADRPERGSSLRPQHRSGAGRSGAPSNRPRRSGSRPGGSTTSPARRGGDRRTGRGARPS